jgi:hypothetical protein
MAQLGADELNPAQTTTFKDLPGQLVGHFPSAQLRYQPAAAKGRVYLLSVIYDGWYKE